MATDIQETYTPRSEIDARLKRLRNRLEKEKIDAALIMETADLFYFSGTAQQAFLHVPTDGPAILMVKKDAQRAFEESSIEQIRALRSQKEMAPVIGSPKTLGMELDVLPVNMYRYFQEQFPDTEIVDISHAVRSLRAVKSAYEIDIIRQASRLSDQLAAFVPRVLEPGMPEIELAGLIEAEARRLGHQGMIRMRGWNSSLFYGHIMGGASAAVSSSLASPTGGVGTTPVFPQGSSFAPIRSGEPVLMDMAFGFRGYLSDHTRIYAIGSLADDLLAAHDAMLEIQELVKNTARPGMTAGSVYELAAERVAELGYADNFMGAGDGRVPFVGHGVGIELDEYPVLARGQKMVLEEGMVVAVEPKAIFPGRGVVGIENTHIVTKNGLEQLGRYPEAVVIV
ncbi:M24 family metallopeptidase [Desulfosudis oleivorans]|uniref:Peptidase M24 n=1 Tax=Desulfosudis oleivorans (strain DSM 6200 / JCM 39069 / Hxd3) TaxID=96561 RepID=A8ZUF8_DESOH|nr:Xaa-Pro peptidase family protein [Desulfosudis oleivorans]ABW67990.1 peptidase M24 [Desulfosudis oleivorans Hxd3]